MATKDMEDDEAWLYGGNCRLVKIESEVIPVQLALIRSLALKCHS